MARILTFRSISNIIDSPILSSRRELRNGTQNQEQDGLILGMLHAMVLGGNPSASPQALAVARSLLADATTCEVTTAFRHANIRSILLKGPTIATWLYEH